MRISWLNLGLISIATAVPLLAADLLLRAMQLPRGAERVLLLSGSDLSSGPDGYRRYQPHRNIEHAAVYGDQLVYRFRLRSNNLGLASHGDVKPGDQIDLAIAGDSFAEGQGGYSWIGEMQQNWLEPLGLRSLNTAIGGSGFGDFAVTARAAKRHYSARKLLVLFIEHDAYRPYQPMNSNRWCSFYSNGALDGLLGPLTCRLYGVLWHHAPLGLSNAELQRLGEQHQAHGLIPALGRFLAQLGHRRGTQASSSALSASTSSLRFGPIPEASLESMRQIKALYGPSNVLLVQLPDQPSQPPSTEQGRGAQQAERFRQVLRQGTGLQVLNLEPSCKLSSTDFHRLDNHPNNSGYQKLSLCLQNNSQIRKFIES